MKTINKRSSKILRKGIAGAASQRVNEKEIGSDEIDIELIDLSPLNYRTLYDQQALEKFAEEIAHHGIISPVTVRKVVPGRYELVAGERRYRAAKLAGLTSMPAKIRELSDEQVVELQLAENLQRENPHPLHEAQAIAQMGKTGKDLSQIATLLGKSKGYIYNRLQLSELIQPLQQIFMAGKLNLNEANAIAAITPSSQSEFFEQHCQNWEKKEFRLYNVENLLSRFRYDLNHAPFDTKDKSLLPKMGACTKCPFNSAVLKTLFPQMAKEAICSNKSCYQTKCELTMQRLIGQALEQHQPEAIVGRNLSQSFIDILHAHPLGKELTVHELYEINLIQQPSPPKQEDFTDSWDMDEEAENEEGQFDQQAFEEAVAEYQTDMEEYNLLLASGRAKAGLLIKDYKVEAVLFNTEKVNSADQSARKQTAKEIDQALKLGTVTLEQLNGELQRLQSREERSQQLDRQKIQLKVHEQFCEQFAPMERNLAVTDADVTASRLIMYQSLDWSSQRRVHQNLFPQESEDQYHERKQLYDKLARLTSQQHCYLVRMAIAAKSDSKFPGSESGHALYQVATQAGLDIAGIENEQQTIADKRQSRVTERTKLMQKHIERMGAKKD